MRPKPRAKTKYMAFVAASIDGRIARSDRSGTDWTSPEDWAFFQKSLSRAGAVIVGHNTYRLAKKSLDKRNTFVLTSKAKSVKLKGNTRFVNPANADLKEILKEKGYKSVAIVGGPKVYNFCLENNMLDELYLTIEPYVFTSGVPVFSGLKFKKHKFILLSVKKINKKGSLLLKYKYEN